MTVPGSFIPDFKALFRNWRRLAASLTFFCLIIYLLLRLLYLIPAFQTSYALKYREAFFPRTNLEMIVLGDSRGNADLNPYALERFTRRIYNFSFTGGRFSFVREFYNRILSRYHAKPKVILYVVHPPDMFVGGRVLEGDSQFFPFKFWLKEVFSNAAHRKTLLLTRSTVLQNRPDVIYAFYPLRVKIDHVKRDYRGFCALSYVKQAPDVLARKQALARPTPIDHAQVAEFRELLKGWKNDGIAVVLIQPPVYKYAQIVQPSHEEFQFRQRAVEAIARELEIPYLNYNQGDRGQISDDFRFFRDTDHLNEIGSEIFSEAVATDLVDVFIHFFEAKAGASYEHLCFLGKIYFLKQNKVRAGDYYWKALAVNSGRPEAYAGLGQLEDFDGHDEPAQGLYLKAAQHDPKDLASRLGLGNLHFKRKAFKEAGEAYISILEMDPLYSDVYTNLGHVFLNMRNFDKARECYKRAMRLNPYDKAAMISLEYLSLQNKS